MDKIAGIPSLEHLKIWLDGQRTTDEGLLQLAKLTNLKSLDLTRAYSLETTAGLAGLKRALPKCEITVDR